MTVTIYRNSGSEIETIKNVENVLNHSVGTGNGGNDIEIIVFTDSFEFDRKEIHLDMWDFYSVRP